MSGHSKWSTIKRQKGVTDMKRGQLFTKLSMAITMSVKQGGGVGDPEGNFRLRLAVEAARSANMPKENITRAIKRASGGQMGDLQELTYEGFGPGGFSLMVETLTDNKQRTISEVKNVFDKNGGSLGTPGSVGYQFEQKGLIVIEKGSHSFDDIFLVVIDAGAEDVDDAGDEIFIYTKSEDLAKVRASIMDAGYLIRSAELVRKPMLVSEITNQDAAQKALLFLEKLEGLTDVQKVYANFDIPEALLRELS